MPRIKRYVFACFILFATISIPTNAQQRRFVTSSRHQLGTEENYSAAVRAGDLDGDGDVDLVVANGRHWPQQNLIFLNDGRGQFPQVRNLGNEKITSYACELADLDGDGDIDIVTGNAQAPCRVFLNDGKANFAADSKLEVISSVRSMTLADIDADQDMDVLVTCRKRPNGIFLNDGSGKFGSPQPFGTADDSTISVAAADINGDKHPDLVLANRDRQSNAILLQNHDRSFDLSQLGTSKNDTRAVATGDFNGDGYVDCAIGNIGAENQIWFGKGDGTFETGARFGDASKMTYAVTAGDLDNDGDLDLVVANVGAANEVFFNQGDGIEFQSVDFGDTSTATYGLCLADLDGDQYLDLAVANSGSLNRVFLNRPATASARPAQRRKPTRVIAASKQGSVVPPKSTPTTTDWPMFHGPEARGVADGFTLPTTWNASLEASEADPSIRWRVALPGLAHSSPVISGDRLFVATAVADAGDAPLQVGRGGAPTAAKDNGEQEWKIFCFDKKSGEKLWEKVAHRGTPQATRHAKATHANSTLTISGNRLVAFFGSEGLYCYDLDGKLLWKRDLGVVNISKYGIGWGYASSPAVHQNTIVLICDDPDNAYIIAFQLDTGNEIWKVSRQNLSQRNWSTPLIHKDTSGTTQVVVNGWPNVISYDLQDGQELWRIEGGGDNPVPTPFLAHDHFYICSAHGPLSPIHTIHPSARGNLTEDVKAAQERTPLDVNRETAAKKKDVLWSVSRGGSYMSTPVVYGDYIYLGNSNGVLRCFHALTGEKVYEERLSGTAGIIASLVAGDGKIYCASENGRAYVIAAGPELEVLATNELGNPCFATPALSEGTIYFRTTRELIAVEFAQ